MLHASHQQFFCLATLLASQASDMSSTRNRSRKRKLFADEVVGVGSDRARRARSDDDQADADDRPRYNSYEDRWPGESMTIIIQLYACQ